MRRQCGPEPPALAGLLAQLTVRPDADDVRLILADLLDDMGPTPVGKTSFPYWLRLGWKRRGPRERWELPRSVRPRQAAQEITIWLCNLLGFNGYADWDHCGQTHIGNRLCWVSEPYARPERALLSLLPLGKVLGVPVAFSRRTWHRRHENDSRLCRVLIFPPPDGKPVPRLR